ncbi:MAG TPA: SEC-C metal-binding domain-containing protein [Terriglobia bacterium]|nr:SEC-C metal-binding domain-containing protein [Terriglobia bacterium]
MPNVPFRRNSPKIGRNDPCPCGNGRKFKLCHGRPEFELPNLIASANLEKKLIEEGKRRFEKHKAREIQRQKQQGLGRPIISIEHKGLRFVAVGNRVHYGKWKSFADFLMNYIKTTLTVDWGNGEIAKPLEERHPLMQWYDRICRLQAQYFKGPDVTNSTPVSGAVSAYNRLAYNLYLIAHNVKDIQTRLIARLKNKDNFQGAFFETQVAAWLIKAGFELEYEDESDRKSRHCEFTATYLRTGEQYSVEAKSRQIETDHSSRPKVGRKLRDALEKKANHKRLIFLDLNKPLDTPETAEIAVDRAERIISQHEGMEIDGAPAPPAYVCITNMSDQYLLDRTQLGTIISFRGFKIDDFMGVQFPSLRDAARARERHWPMHQLRKSMEEHGEIPQTFSGELPSEVFAEKPSPRLRIGQFYAVQGADGKEVKGKLTHATVGGNNAHGILYDPDTNRSFQATWPLTPDEVADYEKHQDTFFGEYQKQGRRVETAMEMFDFFVEGFQDTPKERLIELLANAPKREQLPLMSQKDLVELLAERYTMGMIAKGFAVKSPRNKRRGPPSK